MNRMIKDPITELLVIDELEDHDQRLRQHLFRNNI